MCQGALLASSDSQRGRWVLAGTKLWALKSKEAAYRVADSNNGLCVEVRPTGAKVWRYRYRFAGKASMVTIRRIPCHVASESPI